MAQYNNIPDLLKSVADAIRSKEDSTDLIIPTEFAQRIENLQGGTSSPDTPSTPKWTGHADAEGLRAIGWTGEDITYYQANGVNWNEENDQYHLVSDDNKALYGVITTSNISTYKDRIVYLPKIDTSSVTSMSEMFAGCQSLVSIPQLDTSSVTNMDNMFSECRSLTSIPLLNTGKVTSMYGVFSGCLSLTSIPLLNTSNVTNMNSMFTHCCSLTTIPQLDTSKVTNMYGMFGFCTSLPTIPLLDTSSVTNMGAMFCTCYSLVSIPQLNTSNVTDMSTMLYACPAFTTIPQLDTSSVTDMSNMFGSCYSLTTANLKNVKLAYDLSDANKLFKESLLYIINNEAATSAVTIILAEYAYTRWAEDVDVVAALANHPNISLAKNS